MTVIGNSKIACVRFIELNYIEINVSFFNGNLKKEQNRDKNRKQKMKLMDLKMESLLSDF